MNKKEKASTKIGLFTMFAGPSMIAFTCFVIIPFIYGLYLTFTSKAICWFSELYYRIS